MAGMEFEYKKVEPNHRDFQLLIAELNLSLRQITNDTGESSFVSDVLTHQKMDVSWCI